MQWLKHWLLNRRHDQTSGPASSQDQDLEAAQATLDHLAKPAVFGQLGGRVPDKNNRAQSWWGGNFLGHPDESPPMCLDTGRPMHPVLQIRVDELADVPPPLTGIALLTLWIDLRSDALWEAQNGHAFAVQSYPTLSDLVPVGPGYRESADLPTFPLHWHDPIPEQPGWEDIAFQIPSTIAKSQDDDWFFQSKYESGTYVDLRQACAVKVGGWPTWIQGAHWPKDSLYCLQIDSTDKGGFHFGDAGALYLFKTPDGWALRGDCY